MKSTILITRPESDAAETARQVFLMGFEPVLAPVLSIVNINVKLPESSACQGLIFSSANAVRAFQALKPDPAFLAKPVFAVGDHTTKVAIEAGFRDVRNALGTVRDVVALIRRQMAPPARLLYLRGREIRDNPAILLPQSEVWSIDGITVYGADPVDEPLPEALQAIEGGQVAAVLFYSARSAATFMKLYGHLDFSGTKALCLADSVLESLDRRQWGEVVISARPDQSGMTALLNAIRLRAVVKMDIKPKPETVPKPVIEKTMQIYPTANDDTDALMDAETVIERFGGIRPMATKMNVPVTTVQGWKKRNVIPGNRRDDVVNAAHTYNVDLSDLITNQNRVTGESIDPNSFSGSLRAARKAEDTDPAIDRIHQRAITESGVTHEDMMIQIKKSQLSAIRKSVTASAGLLMVLAMFGGLFIAIGKHRVDSTDARIKALEEQAPVALNSSGGQPTPFAKMMDSLKGRVDSIEGTVQGLKGQAGAVVGSVADGSVTQRLAALEDTVKNFAANPNMGTAGMELQNLVQGMQGRMDKMDEALAEQQKSNTALGQALEGVSPKELKAAAMLIGLSQFRDSLGRSEPFADDLAMMQRLSGNNDPELNDAITKLAPYAEKGVLSPNGLSSELKGLTGDILVASVKGEDVSIQDKAMARFQKYISVEKDGQPLMGGASQARVAKAQALLDAGDVNGAMAELQALQGPARQTAQPVIDQGMVTLMAQNVQRMLSKNIATQIKGAINPVPLTTSGSITTPMGPFKALNNQPVQAP